MESRRQGLWEGSDEHLMHDLSERQMKTLLAELEEGTRRQKGDALSRDVWARYLRPEWRDIYGLFSPDMIDREEEGGNKKASGVPAAAAAGQQRGGRPKPKFGGGGGKFGQQSKDETPVYLSTPAALRHASYMEEDRARRILGVRTDAELEEAERRAGSQASDTRRAIQVGPVINVMKRHNYVCIILASVLFHLHSQFFHSCKRPLLFSQASSFISTRTPSHTLFVAIKTAPAGAAGEGVERGPRQAH
jgi:hypothetical protein